MDLPAALRDRYRARRVLGRGGFGAVLQVEDRELGRDVALKVLRDAIQGEEARKRFDREARLTASIEHPHVVRVFDHGVTPEGASWIAYELVEGTDLADRMADGEVPRADALRWIGQVASALDAAHEEGVLHRDVKPENILLRASGDAVLCDFGIARPQRAGTLLTAEGMVLGTPGTMAPEVLLGEEPTPAADQYGLAAVAFWLLLGRLPHGAEVHAVIEAARFGTPPRLAAGERGDPAAAALLRGLEPDPAARFPDAGSFGRALEGKAARPEETQPVRPGAVGPRGGPAPRARRGWGGLGLVILGLLAAWIGKGVVDRTRPVAVPPPPPEPSRVVPTPREEARSRFLRAHRVLLGGAELRDEQGTFRPIPELKAEIGDRDFGLVKEDLRTWAATFLRYLDAGGLDPEVAGADLPVLEASVRDLPDFIQALRYRVSGGAIEFFANPRLSDHVREKDEVAMWVRDLIGALGKRGARSRPGWRLMELRLLLTSSWEPRSWEPVEEILRAGFDGTPPSLEIQVVECLSAALQRLLNAHGGQRFRVPPKESCGFHRVLSSRVAERFPPATREPRPPVAQIWLAAACLQTEAALREGCPVPASSRLLEETLSWVAGVRSGFSGEPRVALEKAVEGLRRGRARLRSSEAAALDLLADSSAPPRGHGEAPAAGG